MFISNYLLRCVAVIVSATKVISIEMNSEQITNFGEQTDRELNTYAAQDIMTIAAQGPIVVLVGLGVSLFTTDLLEDSRALALTFFVLIFEIEIYTFEPI